MSTLDNLISVEFTVAEINALNDALETIETTLEGKMINLVPEQRRQYGSIGNNTENWINKINDYMADKPEFTPFYLNKPEFDKDMAARGAIKPWLRKLRSVTESLEDTNMLISFDIYQAALAYYRSIKLSATQNVPGSTTIFQDLKAQFPGRPNEVLETSEQDPEEESGSIENENPLND